MIMGIISAILSRWQIALGVVVLLIASHGTAYCSGQKHGKERAEAEQAALQAKALEQARKADYIASEAAKETKNNGEGAAALLGFLTERMRYISGLQAWLALILGAVILNADYLRFKHGDTEAEMGNRGDVP